MKTLLMIDDDLDFIESCRNVLESRGYRVEYECRGDRALDTLRKKVPDLVLLDIVMQNRLWGFEIADAMLRDEQLKNIPVIFLTGYFKGELSAEENEMIRGRGNVKGFLDKPIKPAELLGLVAKIKEP